MDIKKLLNFQFDLLLDDFEGQFDLLNFENECFIPIKYDVKMLNQLLSSDCSNKFFEISFKDDDFQKNELSKINYEKSFENIIENCNESLKNTGLANTYISFGSIKYGDDIAPCLFVPVVITKDQKCYKISRNYNQEIQFNVLLKIVLKDDYGINLPDFDGNVKKIINKLTHVEEIEYKKHAYISNFDLRFNHIFSDLNLELWSNFDEKFNLFNNDKSICNFQEFNNFKKKLVEHSKNSEISDDYLFLKSLLSKNKSILVIGGKSIRNKIKDSFYMIDSESLILELSDKLSKEEFHDTILNNNFVQNEELINIDNLVKKHDEIKGVVSLINKNYSFLSPKQIKKNKEDYLNKIEELQIKNYICELNDVYDYDEFIFEKMENQLKTLFACKENIFPWYKYFSVNDFNLNKFQRYINLSNSIENYLDHFINFNNYLNKRYSIKMFDNLLSVDVLNNLNVLNKSYKYLDSERIIELNKLIKDYYNGSLSEDNICIDEIDNDIKYTELINFNIIDENGRDLIKNNFKNAINYSNYFIDFSNYLIKEFKYIFDFYDQFNFFEIDRNLLNINNSIDDLRRLILSFKKHIDKLINFSEFLSTNVLNRDLEKFAEFIIENDYKENEIIALFRFNFYNSLLNKFLNDNIYIDEKKIISEYELELTDLKKKLNTHNQNLLIQMIYSKPIELNNTDVVLNQKKEFIQDFPDANIQSIGGLLDKYKEFITANKRIFLMDIASVSQFLSNSYEKYFDHVIVTEKLKYNLDELSLLLRSKNKIILIDGDDNE